MNTSRLISLSRFVQLAGLVVGLIAASASAHAGGGVYWAVNVDAPVQGMGHVSTAVSNTPRGVYTQAPVVYAPAPVVYAPPQVVYAPPVVVQPRAYYAPAPVAYYPEPRRWMGWHHLRHHHHHRHHHHDHDRHHDRRDDRRDDGRGHDDRNWRHGH